MNWYLGPRPYLPEGHANFGYDEVATTYQQGRAAGTVNYSEWISQMRAIASGDDPVRHSTYKSEALIRYRQELRDYLKKSREPGAAGRPPVEPKEPAPLDWYVSEPFGAFVLNLPAGEYRIRLRDEYGQVVEGSERRLVAFAPAGPQGVGYEHRPDPGGRRGLFDGLK